MTCQLTNMHEITVTNSWIDNLFQARIKLVWSSKKKVLFIKNRLKLKSENKDLGEFIPSRIGPGDMVKVRSKDEIENLLDEWGGYNGCIFTPEMYEYCNKTLKVLKKIEYFYDEVKQKMCKCKDIYILEGATCSGQRRMFPEDCDRNCFLFWHLLWLEKL